MKKQFLEFFDVDMKRHPTSELVRRTSVEVKDEEDLLKLIDYLQFHNIGCGIFFKNFESNGNNKSIREMKYPAYISLRRLESREVIALFTVNPNV